MKAFWLTAVLLAAACSYPPGAAAKREAEPSGGSATDSARTPWLPVTAPRDPALTELSAHVVGDPSARSEIAVVYTSRVVAVHVRVGDRVRAGDPLVDVIVPELIRAQAAVAAADARAEGQRRRLAKLEALQGEGLVGARETFEVQAQLGLLDAERRAAAAVIAGWGPIESAGRRGALVLRAATDGVVVGVDATLGEVRDATGGPLVQVRGEGSARIELRSPGALPAGATLVFEALDGRAVPLSTTPDATLVDPADGSTLAWLRPEPAMPLPEGLRGRVLVTNPSDDVVQVPERSMRWHDGAMVVVVRDGDVGKPVPVQVVGRSGSAALVRGAVKVGDDVAADATAWLGTAEDEA